jgi:Tol biopolymer transport system component
VLKAGDRLGPYEIVALLGAGGMGEVYRAKDPRLGRDVAIKVLPAEFASDPDRLRRFEQEARAAGQLNHPNILALYDVGSHEGSPYLVSELLEGQSLRERLEGGPLPSRKAIEFAVQIAHGLAAAHEKGIVHRDLKPENLFVTADGHVKILDFGLAKLRPGASVSSGAPAPTVVGGTEPGYVMGTAAYMSPEQVRGQAVDHRSDIFSLGVVLYEMLSGAKAFHRDSAVETMNAILKEEPPELTTLDPKIPVGLARVVQHCLEKHPADRFQSARDLAFDLETLSGTSGEAAAALQAGRVAARSRIRERLAWGVAAAIAVAAIGALLALDHMRRPPEAELVRFSVTGPEGVMLVPDSTAVAISPDGRRLVYTIMDATGTVRLWVRRLDSLAAQPLTGTEGATLPFWSPDSRYVAFFAYGKLRKVPVAGGSPEVICDAPDGRGGSWSKEGVIIFAPQAMGPLLKVAAEGGEPVELARPDRARGDTGLRFPCFLPDGRHFLYVSLPRKQSGFDVYLGALDSKERGRIGSALSAPIYAEPGYLLFALGDRLVAQRFDRSSWQPVGKVMPLGDAPVQPMFDAGTALSASTNGVLAHGVSSPPMTELVWLDRAGRQTGRIPLPPGSYSNPSLSPGGRWATVTKFNSSIRNDLWLVDLQRAVTTRLTFDGLVAQGWGMAVPVVWSPDSTRVAYCTDRSGVYDVYQILASGAGRPEPLLQSDAIYKLPTAWSPDGKYVIFTQLGEGGVYDLWLLPLHGDRTPVPYLRTPFNEDFAAFSPDGRWLAYDSDETGKPEIYVRSFPDQGEKYRVSTSGGMIVQWSRDGKELLFFSLSQYYYGSGPIYAVDVETRPTFRAGTPRVLFTPRPDLSGLAATADLSRFLATVPAEGAPPASITITLNWQAALER